MARAAGFELTTVDSGGRRDVAFEAAVLRGGLLLGLMHERDVPEWAMGALGMSASLDAALADVCLAPIELSAMREALYPVSRDADRVRVAAALLTLCGVAPSSVAMPVADRVQQLQLLRHEFRLTGDIVTGILQFAQRVSQEASHATQTGAANDRVTNDQAANDSSDLVAHDRVAYDHAAPGHAAREASLASAFTAWLDTMRAPGFFRCYFTSEAAATAFIAAIAASAPPARPVTSAASAAYEREPSDARHAAADVAAVGATVDTTAGAAPSHVVILDESAWTAAERAHGPLPMASRIPGPPPTEPDGDPRHASSLPHPATNAAR